MDVTSWLLTRLGLVDVLVLEKAEVERATAIYEKQELLKSLSRARQERDELEIDKRSLTDQIIAAHDVSSRLEEELTKEEEAKILAVAQLENLKEEIGYLREQVKIYQVRLGLLPQERQGQIEATEHKPLRTARTPWAVTQAKIQSQRTEEYWRQKADAVQVDGVAGKTSTDTPTVSDKES